MAKLVVILILNLQHKPSPNVLRQVSSHIDSRNSVKGDKTTPLLIPQISNPKQ